MAIVRLTTDGRLKTDPRPVPGTGTVAFSVQVAPNLLALATVPAGGGANIRLHPSSTGSEFEPAWSGDGKTVAFLQNRGNLNLKLVIKGPAGESIFDPGGGFAGVRHPTFVGGSGKIVFAQAAPGGQHLAWCDFAGKNHAFITSGAGIDEHPAASPDGARIAFSSSREGIFQIYVAAADGSGVRRLTRHDGSDTRPSWHSSGAWLVFCRRTLGRPSFCRLDVATGAVTPLFSGAGFDRIDHPFFDLDGRRILFVGEQGGRQDLYALLVGAV